MPLRPGLEKRTPIPFHEPRLAPPDSPCPRPACHMAAALVGAVIDKLSSSDALGVLAGAAKLLGEGFHCLSPLSDALSPGDGEPFLEAEELPGGGYARVRITVPHTIILELASAARLVEDTLKAWLAWMGEESWRELLLALGEILSKYPHDDPAAAVVRAVIYDALDRVESG